MGYVGEIPGMYYDEGKGKYFKIQANGTVPASSAYSSHDVKRRKLEDRRKQSIKEKAIRQEGRIRQLIRDPLTGGILRREYGDGNKVDGPQIYANGLVSQGHYNEDLPYSSLFTVQNRRYVHPKVAQQSGPWLELHTLDYDRLTKIKWDPNISEKGSSRTEILSNYNVSDGPTSMCIHDGIQKLLATWRSSVSNSGIAIAPTNEDEWDSTPSYNMILGPGTSRGEEVEVLSSTTAPESSNLFFAVGTSDGIMTIGRPNFNAGFLPRRVFPEGHARDVFALEFLRNDPYVLMSGGRDGFLNITDLRVHDFGSQADFIQHPSSVIHIKQLDDHRIIVAGLESSLCQYDLRFRRTARHTQSILQYPEYQNTSTIRIGFDVDVEAGVVAAAQEQDISHPPLQLFSLHGGHALQPTRHSSALDNIAPIPHFGLFRRFRADDVIPCVRFVRESEDQLKSLYVSADEIRRYVMNGEPEWKGVRGHST